MQCVIINSGLIIKTYLVILLQVKVKSLVSMGSMMDILDKHIILKQIMPCIYKMDDCQPAVLMAILGITYL